MRSSSVRMDDANAPSTSTSRPRIPQPAPNHLNSNHSGKNVYQLLARREISPRSKHSSKRFWLGGWRFQAAYLIFQITLHSCKRCEAESYFMGRD